MKPIIGVIEWPYLDKDQDSIFEVPTDISNKIVRHGGIPLGIFPTIDTDFTKKDCEALSQINRYDLFRILSKCDAIIKPGAVRIYNYERLIYDYVVSRDIPFLGICAGMQLMAHYKKPRIENNVRNNSTINHNVKSEYAHKIRINEGSLLFRIFGKEEIEVNSRHNYHIEDSNGFMVAARSEDGYIEAIEKLGCMFQLGVQWHPEMLDDQNSRALFDYFIEASKQYVKKK